MQKKVSRIGVLTSGGDAPGMNAAVRAVVRGAGEHALLPQGDPRTAQGAGRGRGGREEARDRGRAGGLPAAAAVERLA